MEDVCRVETRNKLVTNVDTDNDETRIELAVMVEIDIEDTPICRAVIDDAIQDDTCIVLPLINVLTCNVLKFKVVIAPSLD
jgi:hypothetical protein